MIKLSVVIITFNEEKNIGRCIDSVQDIADDIVVLDSFSTDKTEEICISKDVRFIKHKFDGHIEQKNRVITYAQNPYVLSLDADEALSEELKKSIIEVKNNWDYDSYNFNRLTNYCGKWIKHTGWYPDKKLRLWDSRKGKWGGINPHDKYEMENGTSTKFIKGDLLHYSYYSISEHIKQVDKFTDIGANELFKNNKKTSIVSLLAKTFWKFNRDYFFKLGVLDGYYGFVISVISMYATFIKHAKLRQMYK